MKRITKLLPIVCIVLISSCKAIEDPADVIGTTENNLYVNNWMMDILQEAYYWNEHLNFNADNKQKPDAFFDDVMYWYNPVTAPTGDRFSWIQEDYTVLQDYLNGVASKEIGFDYSLFWADDAHVNVIGQINYVKKGTAAALLGLKRGMIFNKIDGVQLTASNVGSLLDFTGNLYALNMVEPSYNENDSLVGYADVRVANVQTMNSYAENPVYLDSVYTIGSKKIGYFVYHFFSADPGTGNDLYDLQMNAVFARFKAAGITDLVLDLRYNSGGSVNTATNLASNIVPDLSSNKLLIYYEYNRLLMDYYRNKYGPEEFKTYFTTTLLRSKATATPVSINNVGNQLNGKVYILTGDHTASASELIINGLKPFMDVVLIGDTTYGKNVASTTFYDEKHTDKNRWGMQPIIAKFLNSLGESDFTAGFAPDFVVQDGGNGMLEYGDVNERLFSKAISQIVGNNSNNRISKKEPIYHNINYLNLPSDKIRGLQLENSRFLK